MNPPNPALLNPSLLTFLFGFGGSLAAEVVNINQQYSSGSDQLPPRYKSLWFWLWRLLLAVVGGGLALAYGIEGKPLLAATVGISTPLIIQTLARGLKAPASPLKG